MAFTDGKRFCTTCGQQMLELATSIYCPADCDRLPVYIDPEITQPIGRMCPNCGGYDLIYTAGWAFVGYKCVDCTHLFSI